MQVTQTGSAPYLGNYREAGTTALAFYLNKTGTVAEINTWLANSVQFVPNRDQFVTDDLRIYLYHGSAEISGNRLDEQEFSMVGTEQTGTLTGEGYSEITSDQIFTVTDSMRYYMNCDMIVIGAGGSSTTDTIAGGGGAGSWTHVIDSDIVYGSNRTALEFGIGAANADNTGRGGDTFVKDYSSGSSGTTLIYAPGGGGGASTTSGNGVDGGNGGGGAKTTGNGGVTTYNAITNSPNSFGLTQWSYQPFATALLLTGGYKYSAQYNGQAASVSAGGNGGGNQSNGFGVTSTLSGPGVTGGTDPGPYVIHARQGFGADNSTRPTETPVATYNGAILLRFYQTK